MIESERLGEAMDRTLLNYLLKMFTALGIYAESFEKPFLECTSEFYAAQGMKYMQQSDVLDYLKHVEGVGSKEEKAKEKSVEGENKMKHKMRSASQLELGSSRENLCGEAYQSDAVRVELF
ncbi:cullin-4-like isoform X1 [Arachis hypogaea]|uniref:cullin-4-like isoform X1 n=2 Tax=Arachis hypogaea TaxID=3818 RepID=UPI003B21532E